MVHAKHGNYLPKNLYFTENIDNVQRVQLTGHYLGCRYSSLAQVGAEVIHDIWLHQPIFYYIFYKSTTRNLIENYRNWTLQLELLQLSSDVFSVRCSPFHINVVHCHVCPQISMNLRKKILQKIQLQMIYFITWTSTWHNLKLKYKNSRTCKQKIET